MWKINQIDSVIDNRFSKMERLRFILSANRHRYADLIVNEVGKCRSSAIGEIDRSI